MPQAHMCQVSPIDDVHVVQPHQKFGCLVRGMKLHSLPIETYSDIATVQKWEGLRTCLKHRCVRWVLGDVPVVQPHQKFGCLVPIQTCSE